MFDNFDITKAELRENIEINSTMNSEVKKYDSNRNAKENVEIFSKMIKGDDVSKYGKKVDNIAKYISNLGSAAVGGDVKAQSELNAIRTIMVQAPLLERLRLLDMMGEVIRVGKNEEVRFKTYELQGEMAREQANSSSFPFVTSKYRTETMTNYKTITGGVLIDNREIATGNFDGEAVMVEQVQTDMMNQMFYYIFNELYTGIKNATSLKNYAEASGISKTTLDGMLKIARRWSSNGQVTITGDYSVVSQLNNFSGFAINAVTGALTDVRYSQKVMDSLMDTGLLSRYFKHPIVEIPNSYNLTQLNTAGTFYETYMPEGLLFLLPQGTISPLKIGLRGGLESMSATDINLRAEVMRFDMEFGSHLVKEQIPTIALLVDTDYVVDKR